jgi:hypothetical protein
VARDELYTVRILEMGKRKKVESDKQSEIKFALPLQLDLDLQTKSPDPRPLLPCHNSAETYYAPEYEHRPMRGNHGDEIGPNQNMTC